MKKRILLIMILLVVVLIVDCFVCWYFFTPVNPEISEDITRLTPMKIKIICQGETNIFEQIAKSGVFADEDLSFMDKKRFFKLISKCVPVNYDVDTTNGSTGGPTPAVLIISFNYDSVPDNSVIEMCFVSTEVKNHYDVSVSIRDGYNLTKKSFMIETDFDSLYEKYYEKGLELHRQRSIEARESEERAYSEAIEKIKNS